MSVSEGSLKSSVLGLALVTTTRFALLSGGCPFQFVGVFKSRHLLMLSAVAWRARHHALNRKVVRLEFISTINSETEYHCVSLQRFLHFIFLFRRQTHSLPKYRGELPFHRQVIQFFPFIMSHYR